MKKTLSLAIAALLAAGAITVSAAGSGDLLKQEEKSALLFVAAMNDPGAYGKAQGTLSPELAKQLNQETFTALNKQVEAKFGTLKDVKLAALEKFDQGDRVTLLGKGKDDQLVRVAFFFDTKGSPKITDFAVSPVQQQQQAPAEDKK